MTTLKTSPSFVDSGRCTKLPARVHHISEIMPHVLARHGFASSDEPNATQPTPATNAIDLFDVMIACLEEALAT
jgi:hypothetical protein